MIENLEAELYRAFDSEPTRIVGFLLWLAEARGLQLPVRVLDVGCGPGRLLGPLTSAGWRVTGVEPNGAYLEAARTHGATLGVNILQGGFNDITAESAFDMIVGINGSFAYLLSAESRRDALRRCHRALASGGLLFLDLPNFPRILLDYRGPGVFEAELEGMNVTLTRRHEIDLHSAIFTTREEYMLVPGQVGSSTFEATHRQAILTYPQLAAELTGAGFGDPETYTSYDARASERLNSGRMMVAAPRS